MIVTESYEINGRQFVRTYSNEGRYVSRDGISYDVANDPAELGRTYTEGDLIEDSISADEALSIITGEVSE